MFVVLFLWLIICKTISTTMRRIAAKRGYKMRLGIRKSRWEVLLYPRKIFCEKVFRLEQPKISKYTYFLKLYHLFLAEQSVGLFEA